jgi:hypothetical protein
MALKAICAAHSASPARASGEPESETRQAHQAMTI